MNVLLVLAVVFAASVLLDVPVREYYYSTVATVSSLKLTSSSADDDFDVE